MALMDKGSAGATYLIKALSEKSRSSNRLHQAIIEAALLTDDFERNAWTYAELIVFHLFHTVLLAPFRTQAMVCIGSY